MRVVLRVMVASGLLVSGFANAANPANIEAEIAAFQGFFQKRFPDMPLAAYQHGASALPQYAQRRADRDTLMDMPRYAATLEKARVEWSTPFNNGKTFNDCFTDKPAATHYPYYNLESNDIRTVVGDINACLEANGEEPIENLENAKIARLVAAFNERFNGQALAVEVSTDGAQEWYERGKKFYWTKRGQLNFSCADCHVTSAGKSMRGDYLSAGLGHTSGFPTYHPKRVAAGDPWSTTHGRYKDCNERARAKPFSAQSNEYKALEFYEAVMSLGVPLKAPGLRQ